MSGKTYISVKTKKILVGTGITFGTILVFLVSFFLAFTLIVNPIAFTSIGNSDVETENEELKQQVKALEDEVEILNTTVDKYKNYSSAPVIVDSQPTSTTTSQPQTDNRNPVTTDETDSGYAGGSETTGDETSEEVFSPETVTTPEGGIEPEVEPDITVIDITE